MQTMDESRLEAQQMSQDEEDHESESVRSDATTEENDDDEGTYCLLHVLKKYLWLILESYFVPWDN